MMYNNFYGSWTGPFGMNWFFGMGSIVFAILVIWSVAWKGLALWKAAREGSKGWFLALLVVNTLGILEILYLYVFSKHSEHVHSEHNSHHPSAK